jgi:hypothetical protein
MQIELDITPQQYKEYQRFCAKSGSTVDEAITVEVLDQLKLIEEGQLIPLSPEEAAAKHIRNFKHFRIR